MNPHIFYRRWSIWETTWTQTKTLVSMDTNIHSSLYCRARSLVLKFHASGFSKSLSVAAGTTLRTGRSSEPSWGAGEVSGPTPASAAGSPGRRWPSSGTVPGSDGSVGNTTADNRSTNCDRTRFTSGPFRNLYKVIKYHICSFYAPQRIFFS